MAPKRSASTSPELSATSSDARSDSSSNMPHVLRAVKSWRKSHVVVPAYRPFPPLVPPNHVSLTPMCPPGLQVLHCCGYDSVPSDLGAFMLVDYCRSQLGW
jgi:hypothetical protein